MTPRPHLLAAALLCAASSIPLAHADDTASPVPLTRDDLKQALEDSKQVTPRLPLPPLSDEEKARAEQAAREAQAKPEASKSSGRGGLGFGIVNNGRMRNFYLAEFNSSRGAGGEVGFSREPEPGMSLGYPFLTQLFWIVSRANNCTYCMGHQEAKLASAGLNDDQIAALDADWSELEPARRAAFEFTSKLTHQPHEVNDADIAALRAHYDDNQITEMILAIANFNSMNRWTGPLRIPQEARHVFLKPTSAKFATGLTRVGPIGTKPATTGRAPAAPKRRPALESREQVEAQLAAARKRTPRLALAEESVARTAGKVSEGDTPAQWMRLLAVFPRSGASRIERHLATQTRGSVDPRTKAIIDWTAARNDRAWYALGHARKRLQELGFSDDQIFALDDPRSLESPADREVVLFARKITVDPALADDEDFARMRQLFDDKTVAQIVYLTTEAAYFDRVTESAGLTLEQ